MDAIISLGWTKEKPCCMGCYSGIDAEKALAQDIAPQVSLALQTMLADRQEINRTQITSDLC